MRYGLYLADLRPARTDSRGIINYALGLAAALPALLTAGERLHLLTNDVVREQLPPPGPASRLIVDVVAEPRDVRGRLVLDHVTAVRWARRRQLDVLHLPKGHLPLWVPPGLTTVATVHDDIPVRYARNQFGGGGRTIKSTYFAWTVTRAVRTADRVLTVSRFAASQLALLVPGSAGRLVVTGEAPSLPMLPLVPLAERDPVILVVGSRFPHKRIAETLRWCRRFIDSERGAGLRVKVTGELDAEASAQCQDTGVERVRESLSGAALAGLMGRSRVLAFGSEYEGFGLPPVEAYCLGTPACHQRAGAMAEVLEGMPGGYAPARYEQFAEAMAAVLRLDDAALGVLSQQMRARFRWEDVAQRTVDAYRVATSEHRRPPGA